MKYEVEQRTSGAKQVAAGHYQRLEEERESSRRALVIEKPRNRAKRETRKREKRESQRTRERIREKIERSGSLS